MVKKAYTVFDIIDEVNHDLGEDLVCAYVSEEDDCLVSAMVTDKDFCVSRVLIRQIGTKGKLFAKKDDIEDKKKKILSMFCNCCMVNKYNQILEVAKSNIEKVRNYHKVLLYLSDRYGMPFAGYANMGEVMKCYVVFPNIRCRMAPMFKFAKYFTLWFEGNKISKKSLEAYCRKMDKVAERMKCIWKAFDDHEYATLNKGVFRGKNFYNLCEIKRCRSGDWMIKFPYTLTAKSDNFYGDEREMLKKLMNIYRYKDTNYCIWKASTPQEFEITRELLK